MIGTIEFTVDSSKLEEFLETRGDIIIAALRKALTEQTKNLLSHVLDDKLRGQVLNQRSGNLINSSFTNMTETADKLLGTVNIGGKTAPYAAIHEFGGTINIPAVDNKLMVFEGGSEIFAGIESRYAIFTRRHKAFTVACPRGRTWPHPLRKRSRKS